jgi:hypothetical protein
VIEPSTVKKWAREVGLDENNIDGLLNEFKLKKAIIDDMNRLATENKFNSLEKIKIVHLINDPFT